MATKGDVERVAETSWGYVVRVRLAYGPSEDRSKSFQGSDEDDPEFREKALRAHEQSQNGDRRPWREVFAEVDREVE